MTPFKIPRNLLVDYPTSYSLSHGCEHKVAFLLIATSDTQSFIFFSLDSRIQYVRDQHFMIYAL